MKKMQFMAPLLAGSAVINGQNSITVSSTAFKNNEQLPLSAVHSHCGGQNIMPPLAWSRVPKGTQGIALIIDDPNGHDEKGNPWVHGIVFNIDPATKNLDAKNVSQFTQGQNSWGQSTYGGACPPERSGVHHYNFTVYALDAKLDLKEGATVEKLKEAMQDHVLALGKLVGLYERK